MPTSPSELLSRALDKLNNEEPVLFPRITPTRRAKTKLLAETPTAPEAPRSSETG